MIKLIFLAFLSTIVAEDGKAKLYSMHAPQHMPGSLNLTTGELKLFSGHAMSIIRSKCPAVDSDKIFQVTKYIGKLIAKTDPVAGTSKDFKRLQDTMTTCAKEGPIKAPVHAHEEHRSNVFRTFFYPFRQMNSGFFKQPESDHDEVPIVDATGIDSGLVKSKPVEAVAKVETSAASTEAPTRRIIKTTIFVRPEDMQAGIRSSGGFFNWVHNIFSRIGGFFGNFLPFGIIRKKRDVSDSQQIVDLADGPSEATYQVYTPPKDESKGKRSFGQLIDQMCRLYCDTCSGQKDIMNFKRAAKELLTFLFNEDSGIEVAAKKFLDKEFLQSIEACE